MECGSFFDRNPNMNDINTMYECFVHYKNGRSYLCEQEFLAVTTSVLNGGAGEKEMVSFSKELFGIFDRNRDQKIDINEFECMWKEWIVPLLSPVSALVIVDVQNDFISGSLALKNCSAKQEGSEVVPVINELLKNVPFDLVAYSFDHHPQNHISFIENVGQYKLSEDSPKKEGIVVFDTVIFEGSPRTEQKLWPQHCVQGSWGARLHEELKLTDNHLVVYKGMDPLIDSYSAFFDNMKASKTKLHAELKQREVTHVFVCGLALDVCVAYTALDALELNYATVLVHDASRGTDVENIAAIEEKLRSKSGVVATSDQVLNLAKGKDVRHEFARILAERAMKLTAM